MPTCSEEPPEVEPGVNQEVEEQMALSTWLIIVVLMLYVHYRLTKQLTAGLFRALKLFLQVLGRFCSFCANVASTFPSTLYQALKQHSVRSERFKRYVVCKKCHQVYHLNECFEGSAINWKCKSCNYRGLQRSVCGTGLLKSVELSTRKKVYVPFLTYCYVDLKTAMQRLLNSAEFVHSCQHWRQKSSDGMLTCVYSGRIWKEFLEYETDLF